jgi:CheY-like chemotaxis protein
MAVLDTPILEESVRDCLAHLYDYTFLQDHPLVHMLVPDVQSSVSRVQAFQELILSAIDRLKPPDQSSPHTKDSRLYSILNLRYQQQQQVQYVLRQLNLGERQFYRDYAKAVQALTHILEELSLKTLQKNDPPAFADTKLMDTTASMYAELKRTQRQNSGAFVNAEVFFQNILMAVKGLSERCSSVVTIQCHETIIPPSLDQTCLRQIIIWMTSQLLTQSPSNSCFVISFSTNDSTARVTFSWQGELSAESNHHLFEERHRTFEALLTTLAANIYARKDAQNTSIVLDVPLQQQSILIIDDNPDVIGLFRHYVNGEAYQMFIAYDGVQAITLAREIRPKMIILDVLMPDQDGWDILRHLKNHPTTFDTPVVICSILDVSDLALLLGADGFLQKPPSEAEFLDMLRRFL